MDTNPAKNKAVFLDRDGVLNQEMGDYVCRLEDFHVLEQNIAPLKTLQDKGYLLIVATNQGGLAKGWYSEEELGKMHTLLRDTYRKHGVEFTDIYYCPHHPDFTGDCDCRKPKPGMLLDAELSSSSSPLSVTLTETTAPRTRSTMSAKDGGEMVWVWVAGAAAWAAPVDRVA